MSLFYQKILLKKSYKFITYSSLKHYYLNLQSGSSKHIMFPLMLIVDKC